MATIARPRHSLLTLLTLQRPENAPSAGAVGMSIATLHKFGTGRLLDWKSAERWR
jgi:hypothetical protein